MIEVKNVTKKYGNFVAIDDVSFEIKDNEVVGFLGPNGAGKSTTMNMITGFIDTTKGRIVVNGHDISKTPKKAKREIGYMPEGVPLYTGLTVKEFITYMAELKNVKRKDRKQEVQRVIKETGLEEVQKKLIKHISRGYKQRVGLAGALVGNPKVLILDEPTVGLDPKQITEIRELIKNLGKNHTVILSSHILSEVSQICERVIIINKGKILAIDTPKNLENKTQKESVVLVTVEDKKDKMKSIKITGAKEIKFVKSNPDGTKQYSISAKKEVDIRKEIFSKFPKMDITIFELKNIENTLEDAFLKIIGDKEAEIKAEKEKKAEDLNKRKLQISLMDKKDRKIAIKEDKKKAKEDKIEAFNKEYEKDRAFERELKEEKKKAKEEKKNASQKKKNEKKANVQEKKNEKKEKVNKDNLQEKKEENKEKENKDNKVETNNKTNTTKQENKKSDTKNHNQNNGQNKNNQSQKNNKSLQGKKPQNNKAKPKTNNKQNSSKGGNK